MSDDIVNRLRDLKHAMNECGFTGISAVTNSAADEIERLREELEQSRLDVARMEDDYFRLKEHGE